MTFVVATCAFTNVAQRTLRALVGVLAIVIVAAAAAPARAAPLGTGLARATAALDVIPNGDGTVTPDPVPTGAEATCVGSPDEGLADVAKHCTYDYAPGQQVVLRATANAAGVSFAGWSDERCPQTSVCTLPIDDARQSVVALFSPQRVLVRFDDPGGAGTVSTGSGACTRVDATAIFDCGTAPILSQVTLVAGGPDAATWDGTRCDPPEPGPVTQSTCTVSVYRLTWASVGFGVDPPAGIPPAISVRFRIIKRGSGSGTVRSQHVDCGGSCTVDEDFGTQERLAADAASGSSFTGWRGACANAPSCSLAVGPVTAVVALFDAAAPSKPTTPGSGPSRSRPRFVAGARRIVVSGHGRHRRILMRLRLNARAAVRATLSRKHRRVAARRWRVAPGTPLLRLRVPARAPRGSYVLALSFRSDDGQTSHVKRRLRVPR